jgi:acyl dehydratase
MSATTSQFNTEALGKWGEERPFTVEAERTIAYAKATNDENPLFLSGEYAPPVFAIVPVWECLGPATFEVVPGELLMRVVHGEQDITFHQPIRPGMELVSRAAPVGVHGAPNGVVVTTKVECRTVDGEPVNDQWMTSFFRGVEDDVAVGEKAPSHRLEHEGDPVTTVTQTFDADQTFRYSEASGDPMPIHLDNEFAVAMGLPGIIIHGLCTMAFTSRAALDELCDGDPERLRRLAVRFSRICQPEQTLETTIWPAGEEHGVVAYPFESVNSAGETAIKDGLAEVATN